MLSGEKIAAERQFRNTISEICRENGVTYRDFYDIDSFGGDPEEFFDPSHATFVNTQRMMNALFNIPPEKKAVRVPTDEDLLDHLPERTSLTLE